MVTTPSFQDQFLAAFKNAMGTASPVQSTGGVSDTEGVVTKPNAPGGSNTSGMVKALTSTAPVQSTGGVGAPSNNINFNNVYAGGSFNQDPNAAPIFRVSDITNEAPVAALSGGDAGASFGGSQGGLALKGAENQDNNFQIGSSGLANGQSYDPNWDPKKGFDFTLKTGDKVGTNYNYQLDPTGQYYLPTLKGQSEFDTNPGGFNRDLVSFLAVVAGGAAAGAAAGGGEAAAGVGVDATGGAETAIGGSSYGGTAGYGGTVAVDSYTAPTGVLDSAEVNPNAVSPATEIGPENAGTLPQATAPEIGPESAGTLPQGAGATNSGNSLTDLVKQGAGKLTQDPSGIFKDAGGALNLYQGLTGSPLFGNNKGDQSRTGTTTQQTQVTPDAYYSIIKDIIENPQTGISAVMTGQASAGGYGGSVAALQMNDLITRAASEIAKLSAPTVQTVDLHGTNGGLGGGGGQQTGLTGNNVSNDLPGLVRLIGRFFEGSGGGSSTPGAIA